MPMRAVYELHSMRTLYYLYCCLYTGRGRDRHEHTVVCGHSEIHPRVQTEELEKGYRCSANATFQLVSD